MLTPDPIQPSGQPILTSVSFRKDVPPCHCPQCSESPLPTYTEEFKRLCLARQLLGRDGASRQSFYREFGAQHGKAAAEQLINDVKSEYERAKAVT